eukprot:Em0003g1871a
MVQLHHEAMKRRTPMPTVQYRFLSQSQQWVSLAMKAFSFVNPFSQQVEFVVCTNVVLSKENAKPSSTASSTSSTITLPQSDHPHGNDKQDRIEHFVRMAITQQAEQQMKGEEMRTGGSVGDTDAFDSFLPHLDLDQVTSSGAGEGGRPLSLQENAEAAHKILEEYEKSNASSSNRKDLHYNFPPGLFSSEVDLEGSQVAYQYLLQGLDNPNDFQQLLVQVEANPLHSQNMFGDINFDIFD